MSNLKDAAYEAIESLGIGFEQPPVVRVDPEALSRSLDGLGIKFILAGGYVRDLFFGAEPKDVDYCVFNTTEEQLESAVDWLNKKYGYQFAKVDPGTGTGASTQEDEEDANERLYCVYQDNTSRSKPIDLIHYRCNNFIRVLEQFDCNLNQFHFMPQLGKGAVMYHGDVNSLINSPSIIFLKDVGPERYAKMQSKFATLVCGRNEEDEDDTVDVDDFFDMLSKG